MKFNIMKTSCNVFLLFLLITVFMVACSNENTTFALYDINGTVTDNATNLPLKKIRLIRQGTSYLLFSDTTNTDSLGRYSFSLTDYYSKKATFSLKVEDADGELNGGEFMTQTVNVEFSSASWSMTDVVGDYKGQAIKIQDIKLTKK
jgi:putative lipoprotein (rSAM/lipoprotein system)